jgi:hypothetical protein
VTIEYATDHAALYILPWAAVAVSASFLFLIVIAAIGTLFVGVR